MPLLHQEDGWWHQWLRACLAIRPAKPGPAQGVNLRCGRCELGRCGVGGQDCRTRPCRSPPTCFPSPRHSTRAVHIQPAVQNIISFLQSSSCYCAAMQQDPREEMKQTAALIAALTATVAAWQCQSCTQQLGHASSHLPPPPCLGRRKGWVHGQPLGDQGGEACYQPACLRNKQHRSQAGGPVPAEW